MTSCVVDRAPAGTTTAIPPAPDGAIRRDRLRTLLDSTVATAPITLARAQAGRGRTVMLADWARTGTTAWVSIDAGMHRPDRFWAAVAAAVARCVPSLGADLDRAVGADDVIAGLDRLPSEVRLVLDDVHDLTDPAALDALRTLVRYRPTRLRLVLSSRTEPALPLARLRLQGDLVDLDGDVLTFSPEESAAFVAGVGLPVRDDDGERLHHLTGGWAAALRLATDAAVTRPAGLEGVLAALDGAAGPDADLLARGMLRNLTEDDRSLLAAVSLVAPVPSGLAVELLDHGGAPDALRRLRDLGLVGDDPILGQHTVQPLLGRHLRAELARRQPARKAVLHGRAARWLAGAGHPAPALEHARQARDRGLVADLVRDWAVPLVLAGHDDDLRAALRKLGPTVVAQDRRLRAAEYLLESAGLGLGAGAGDPGRAVAALRALSDRVRAIGTGDPRPEGPGAERAREARAAAAEALDAASEGARLLLLGGDPATARPRLEAALSTARAQDWASLTMSCAALLTSADLADGDTAGMERHASAAVAAAARGGCCGAAPAISAHAALAYAALLRARPDEARRHAAEGLAAATEGSPAGVRLQLHALHGAAEADVGRPSDGLEEIRRARAAFADRALSGREATLVAVLEHEAAIAAGRTEHARAVRRWITGRVGTTGDVLLMASRADPATGPSLRPVLDGSVPALLAESDIEARLRQIGDGQVVADPAGARSSLQGALDRAAPLGLVRPFAHSPGPVRRLMAHQVGSFGDTDGFVRRALAARPPGRRARPVDALSERETAVLGLLPSLATMSEIARQLHVSVNTVKTQVGAIYAKLGVGDRRDAVVAAYDAGLLPTPDAASG